MAHCLPHIYVTLIFLAEFRGDKEVRGNSTGGWLVLNKTTVGKQLSCKSNNGKKHNNLEVKLKADCLG